MSMFKHWFKRAQQDRADGVLVFTIISIPLLFICFGLGLDLTKNAYVKSSLNTMAQNAADRAIQNIDATGSLTAASATTFVNEFSRQRGKTSESEGTGEANAFIGGTVCSTLEIDGKERKLPYMKLTYDAGRGQATAARTGVVTVENGAVSSSTLVRGVTYRSFNATVYEASPNFILGLAGQPCQTFRIETTAVAFGSNEDLR
jgi:hypothetical protein